MIETTPTHLRDVAKIFPELGRREWKALVVQICRSVGVTVRHGDQVLLVAGLYPHADHCEAWVCTAPGLRSSRLAPIAVRHVIALVKYMRRVSVVVKADNETGLRFARLAGFKEHDRILGGGYVRLMLNP